MYSGSYSENLIINTSINLTGDDPDNTIIDGGDLGSVIIINAEWVNISNVIIQNSGNEEYDAGIKVYSDNNNISDNIEGFEKPIIETSLCS